MSFVFESVSPYRQKVRGTWGDFRTSNTNQVFFLSTVTRLSPHANDAGEMTLTEALVPVREIVNTSELRFSELLQRDLDDFRVSNSLIPYLLSRTGHAASFFPPILAVLLPYTNKTQGDFPAFVENNEPYQDPETNNLWRVGQSGESFRFKKLLRPDRQLQMFPRVGELEWNDHNTQLMVIDGQHRAMALLALYRTKYGKWKEGNQFRHFYEERWGNELKDIELPNIDIPVTICFFPTLCGQGKEIHKAARTLFVDVNRNARQPSEARNILLSETHLLEIFTRGFMDEVRDREQKIVNDEIGFSLPLASIEYDRSSGDAAKWDRYTCMTNVETIKSMIANVLWGPSRFHKSLLPTLQGAQNNDETLMRENLDLLSAFGDECGDMPTSDLSNAVFPRSQVDSLRDRFVDVMGNALISLFSETEPFRSHHSAVKKFDQDWQEVGDTDYLLIARKAVIDGSGQYWALKEANRVRLERRTAEGQLPPESTATRAWSAIEQRRSKFEEIRGTEYIGSIAQSSASKAFSSAMTIAGELGLALSLPFLRHKLNLSVMENDRLSRQISLGINAFLGSSTDSGVPRKLIWDGHEPTNMPSMLFFALDRHKWPEMRLLWLRMILSDEAMNAMTDESIRQKMGVLSSDLLPEIDRALLTKFADRLAVNLRDEFPDKKTREKKALEKAFETLPHRIASWFGSSALSIATLDSISSSTESEDQESEDDEQADVSDGVEE